jgi:hypothetical protein
MLWLSRPPLLRWTAALCLVSAAAWVEFAPRPTVDVAFLAVDVGAGEPITPDVVEFRAVPDPGFSHHRGDGFATMNLRAGDPLLPAMVTTVSVPPGWLVIEAPLPGSPIPGSQATAVILPETPGQAPTTVAAIVLSAPGPDPFGATTGTVAIAPAHIAEAAAASASGRLVIGVATP